MYAFGFGRCMWGTDWTRAVNLLTYDGGELSLPLRSLDTDYHYFTCMKVTERGSGRSVPDSREPGVLRARILARTAAPETVLAGANFKLPVTLINTGDTLWLTGQTVRSGVVMPGVKITDESNAVVIENHGPLLPRAVSGFGRRRSSRAMRTRSTHRSQTCATSRMPSATTRAARSSPRCSCGSSSALSAVGDRRGRMSTSPALLGRTPTKTR